MCKLINNHIKWCYWLGGVSVSHLYEGCLVLWLHQVQPQYPAPGTLLSWSSSGDHLQYIPHKCDLVFYSSAPLMGGHSARQTSSREAMFHKYRHISRLVSILKSHKDVKFITIYLYERAQQIHLNQSRPRRAAVSL